MRIIARLIAAIWGGDKTQSYATSQSRALYDALLKRGVKAELEYPDGFKHVDIAIIEAKIYVEIDGIHHFIDSKQIAADFGRSYYSNADGFDTFHVTNQIIDKYLNEVADAITRVAKDRIIRARSVPAPNPQI